MPVESAGALLFESAASRPDLLAPAVTSVVRAWRGPFPSEEFTVAVIDPVHADPAAFCARYGIDPAHYADCRVVAARRAGREHLAACVVPANGRLDLAGAVRRHFGAREVVPAEAETVHRESGMEPGSVTPIGLPGMWRVLVAPALLDLAWVLAGSGVRRSKLRIPGTVLAALPGSAIVAGLSVAGPSG